MVALRPPLGLGRLRSRQRDRDEPRGRGCLFGCPRCCFKPQHKDFCQHGLAPWLLWRFVGGVALAVQPVNGIVRSRRGWPRMAVRGVKTVRGGDWSEYRSPRSCGARKARRPLLLRFVPRRFARSGAASIPPRSIFHTAVAVGYSDCASAPCSFRGQGLGMGNVDWKYDHRLDPLGPCRCWRLALV